MEKDYLKIAKKDLSYNNSERTYFVLLFNQKRKKNISSIFLKDMKATKNYCLFTVIHIIEENIHSYWKKLSEFF